MVVLGVHWRRAILHCTCAYLSHPARYAHQPVPGRCLDFLRSIHVISTSSHLLFFFFSRCQLQGRLISGLDSFRNAQSRTAPVKAKNIYIPPRTPSVSSLPCLHLTSRDFSTVDFFSLTPLLNNLLITTLAFFETPIQNVCSTEVPPRRFLPLRLLGTLRSSRPCTERDLYQP